MEDQDRKSFRQDLQDEQDELPMLERSQRENALLLPQILFLIL
jgi:hypothetical protein